MMTGPNHLLVLELFSGIGGMHTALNLSQVSGTVCGAIDINTVANEVYSHNFPSVKIFRNDIKKITADLINKLNVNTILMSPPCQPFTRIGKKKDVEDNRCAPLSHIINILPDLHNIKYILVENVTGFESSEAGERLRQGIDQAGFAFRELMITPLQLGIPNCRERYYMIAVKNPLTFQIEIPKRQDLNDDTIRRLLNEENHKFYSVGDILDIADNSTDYDDYLIPNEVLQKRIKIMDIVTKTSTKTCCFTKSYTHYIEGTGSVYCPHNEDILERTCEQLKTMDETTPEYLNTLVSLRLRFFNPKEVQTLLSFPDSFSYPPEVTKKQKYRLLGNSINVNVVSRLIKLMTNCT